MSSSVSKAILGTHETFKRGLYSAFHKFQSQHKPVTTPTLSRWRRKVLSLANVGNDFKSHSTRAAATNVALAAGVSLKEISRAA